MKVMIVDDEPIFRMGIRSCVPWDEIGCSVCGEAANGKDALSAIQEYHPDVVFLDIKMPVMDGIEVMRRLAETHQKPYVVILSCFNEYEYVREAMKLGAYDYLFKPVMGAEEITNVLIEIRDKCNDARKNDKNCEKEIVMKIQEILRESVELGVSSENKQQLIELDRDLVQDGFIVVGVCFEKDREKVRPSETVMQFCQNALTDVFGEHGIYCFFYEKTDIFYGVIKASERGFLSQQKMKAEMLKAVSQIEQRTGSEIRIGISHLRGSIDTYTDYINQVLQVLSTSWFTREKIAFPIWKKGNKDDRQKQYDNYTVKLQELLGKREIGKIRELLDEIKEDVIRSEYYFENDYCYFLATNMVAFMRHFQGGEVLERLLLGNIGLISNLYHKFDIDAANEECCHVLEICYGAVENMESGKNQEVVIRQAMAYIQENYAQRLSLDDLADRYHLNKNYFCKIFKEISGKTLVNFITEVRLEKATELLEKSDKKIGTIAVDVGFLNYSYFCKTYRKYYNISPTEVRRKCISSENRT